MTKRGFTLVELLVVISIIGLLASVVLASLKSARLRSQDSTKIQALVQVRNALEIYRSTYGVYPLSGTGGSGYWNGGAAITGPKYISKLPADATPVYTSVDGSTYTYEIHGLTTAPTSGMFYDSLPNGDCTSTTCAVVTPPGAVITGTSLVCSNGYCYPPCPSPSTDYTWVPSMGQCLLTSTFQNGFAGICSDGSVYNTITETCDFPDNIDPATCLSGQVFDASTSIGYACHPTCTPEQTFDFATYKCE